MDAASVSEGIMPVGIEGSSIVKIVGNQYATKQSIPAWVKNTTHVVSQINGDTALPDFPGGICSWVYLSDLGLV